MLKFDKQGRDWARGQVLIIVAVALFALVAVVALAVDLGHVMRERRYMQNAADAGALAGAQEICFGDPDLADDKAFEYAVTRNGAEGAEITVHSTISVTVVATETVETFFAGLIGFKEIPIGAEAAAICGKAQAAGGVWPVGFDLRRWRDEEEDLDCDEEIIIWESGPAKCDAYDCCVVYEDQQAKRRLAELCKFEPKIYPLDNLTWVDFSAGISGDDPCDNPGSGRNELSERIIGSGKDGTCESFVSLPDCFVRAEGGKIRAWMDAQQAAGRIVTIPLYDPCYSGKDDNSGTVLEVDPENFCESDYGVCEMEHDPGNLSTQERFYITEFACIQIGVERNGEWYSIGYLAEKPDPDRPSASLNTVRVMVATIPCDEDGRLPADCGSALGWTPGEIPDSGDIRSVSLIK